VAAELPDLAQARRLPERYHPVRLRSKLSTEITLAILDSDQSFMQLTNYVICFKAISFHALACGRF